MQQLQDYNQERKNSSKSNSVSKFFINWFLLIFDFFPNRLIL